MQFVSKYNSLKAISLLLTVGTPSVTMLIFNTVLADSPAGAVSILGVISVIIALFFLKDKIAENIKMPSPLVAAVILLGAILLLENIIVLAKYTCLIMIAVCGVDELTFKNWYKNLERNFIKAHTNIDINDYKKLGFIITTTKTLLGV